MTDTLKVHFSSETVEWATPQLLFDDLDAEFGFETDVCATPENSKCATFFIQQTPVQRCASPSSSLVN